MVVITRDGMSILRSDGDAERMTLQQLRKLPDPVPCFKVGNRREKIQALGESKKFVVVANAIAVRKGQ